MLNILKTSYSFNIFLCRALLSNYRVVSATTNLRDENRIKGFSSHDYAIHKVSKCFSIKKLSRYHLELLFTFIS